MSGLTFRIGERCFEVSDLSCRRVGSFDSSKSRFLVHRESVNHQFQRSKRINFKSGSEVNLEHTVIYRKAQETLLPRWWWVVRRGLRRW